MKKIELNTEQFNELNRFALVRSGLDNAWHELFKIEQFVPRKDRKKINDVLFIIDDLKQSNIDKFDSNVKHISDE